MSCTLPEIVPIAILLGVATPVWGSSNCTHEAANDPNHPLYEECVVDTECASASEGDDGQVVYEECAPAPGGLGDFAECTTETSDITTASACYGCCLQFGDFEVLDCHDACDVTRWSEGESLFN